MERVKKGSTLDLKKESGDWKDKIMRLIFYFFLVVFVAVSGYIFLFSNLSRIRKVEIFGNQDLDKSALRMDVENFIFGKYLGVIPRDEFLLISQKKVSHQLLNHFRKIESAEVRKTFPDKLEIRITERKALVLWCSGGPCYVVDEKGLAFSGIDLDSPYARENKLIKITDNSARPVTLGEQIIQPERMNYILNLPEELKSLAGIEMTGESSVPSYVAEELEVMTQGGWRVFFSSAFPADEAIKMLKVFLDQKNFSLDLGNLDYIDLRVEGKLYYKLKNNPEKITSEEKENLSSGTAPVAPVKDETKDEKKKN
jgi:cell division septal protein FtsQ